jgi:hypothetical protein
MYYNATLRRVRATIVAMEKQQVLHTLCACVALGIRRAMRMRHTAICGLPGSTIVFPRYLKKDKSFEKKIEYKRYVLIFSTTFVRNISHSKKIRARYDKNIYLFSSNVPVILEPCSNNTQIFSNNTQITYFMKIRPVGAEFFHADRRIYKHDEANSRFCQFCERA